METFLEQENRIREKSFLLMVPMFAIAGLLWSTVYYFKGLTMSAMIPGAYSAVSLLSILLFRWYKNFPVFRNIQLSLILVLPWLLHLSIGNFITSSGVILWSTLCPLGALAFHNSRAATNWFLLFIGFVISVFFLEGRLFPGELRLPDWLISLFFGLNIGAVTFLSFFVLRYFVTQNETVRKKLNTEQQLLAAEREKSEKLLLNILPVSIAKRLKEGENVIANEYSEAGVLFADIVGFTGFSQRVTPAVLVENLNRLFTRFDHLVEIAGLEKIKTIGDSYMVASGLPELQTGHLQRMADLAIAMRDSVEQFSFDNGQKCEIRIGMDAGPVIAGVIGSRKFIYDVWGNTVNTASRMESYGEKGKIQITGNLYQHLQEDFDCVYRGAFEIKGKGEMKLYFLTGRKNN
jgi:guanylate cyclase